MIVKVGLGSYSPSAGATRQVRRRRPRADVAVRLTEHQPFFAPQVCAPQVRSTESGRDLVPGQAACASGFPDRGIGRVPTLESAA